MQEKMFWWKCNILKQGSPHTFQQSAASKGKETDWRTQIDLQLLIVTSSMDKDMRKKKDRHKGNTHIVNLEQVYNCYKTTIKGCTLVGVLQFLFPKTFSSNILRPSRLCLINKTSSLCRWETCSLL